MERARHCSPRPRPRRRNHQCCAHGWTWSGRWQCHTHDMMDGPEPARRAVMLSSASSVPRTRAHNRLAATLLSHSTRTKTFISVSETRPNSVLSTYRCHRWDVNSIDFEHGHAGTSPNIYVRPTGQLTQTLHFLFLVSLISQEARYRVNLGSKVYSLRIKPDYLEWCKILHRQ
jgi:hypothetical protein